MNYDLFSVNSKKRKWYKKILKTSFIFLTIGNIVTIISFILQSAGILTWPDKYFSLILTASISLAILLGVWGGSAHARREMHSMVPTMTFILSLIVLPISTPLLGLIYLGMTSIIFGLTLMYTIFCDERSSY